MARSKIDVRILFITRVTRLFAYGFLSVVLVLYLTQIGLSEREAGLLLTLTLMGDAIISLLITTSADRAGRRHMLRLGAALMIMAGALFALTNNFALLLIAAIVGVISPSGNEIGPFLSIEQAALSQLVSNEQRTRVFAWYNLVGSFATALGSLSAGGLMQILQNLGASPLRVSRAVVIGYAIIGVALLWLFTRLSPAIEAISFFNSEIFVADNAPRGAEKAQKPALPQAGVGRLASWLVNWLTGQPANWLTFSPVWFRLVRVGMMNVATSHRAFGLRRSRRVVIKLSGLFALDAFAGGFVVQSLMAYWFHVKFGVAPATLGGIFFGANILAGISALSAARLAKRIGLINTMVFTHLPSNLLLMLVPLMPSITWAIVMLLLRFSISQMDVPTRQSYTMAVVSPDERSAASGVTSIARSVGASLAPALSGQLLANATLLSAPFFLAGGLKILYDLLLYRSFRSIRPPEEKGSY